MRHLIERILSLGETKVFVQHSSSKFLDELQNLLDIVHCFAIEIIDFIRLTNGGILIF